MKHVLCTLQNFCIQIWKLHECRRYRKIRGNYGFLWTLYFFIDSNIANFDSRCIAKTFRIVGIDLKIHKFRKRWKCILHCDKLSNNKLLIDQCVGLQILILPSLVLTILLWIFCQSKYFIDSTKFNLIHEEGESKNYVKQLILK